MSTFRQKVQATTNWVKPDPEAMDEAPRKARRTTIGRRKRPAAPVTAHRLFPAFAALWFAALFGLGSLAIPGSLLGALVLKTGLPALVPAAAPPLGFTAHLLLAFVLAGFGAALGFALALRLHPRGAGEVRPAEAVVTDTEPQAEDVYKVRARDAHPDAPPRRPLVLTEAFADPLVEEAEPAEPLLRRKPGVLASEEVSDAGPWIPEFTPGGASAIRPLDLSALDLADPVEELVEEPAFAEPDVDAVEAPTELAPEARPAEELSAPALLAATPQLPVGFVANLPEVAAGLWSPVAGAPLANLGLVQLIERLALAIAAQKVSNAAVIDAAPDAEIEAAVSEHAPDPAREAKIEPEFEPGPFSRPQLAESGLAGDVPAIGSPREAILRRLGAMAAGDLTGGAESAATGAPLFTRTAVAPVSAAPTDAVVSLRPTEPAFAPPVSPAPSATAAPLESDEALRSALATLQRMSARG